MLTDWLYSLPRYPCLFRDGSRCCGSATYVDRGGEQSYPQPTLSQHSRLYGFLLEGSLSHLQGLCDRTFNALTPNFGLPRLHYRPVTHYVMLTFGDNPELRSQAPAAQNKGFVGEHEVMFWVLTMAGYQIGPFFGSIIWPGSTPMYLSIVPLRWWGGVKSTGIRSSGVGSSYPPRPKQPIAFS